MSSHPDVTAKIVELRRAGKKFAEIGRIVGLNKGAVWYRYHNAGKTKKKSVPPREIITPAMCRTCKVNPLPVPRSPHRVDCDKCRQTQKQRQTERKWARKQAKRFDLVVTPCLYCGTLMFVGHRFTETDRKTGQDLGHHKVKNFLGELVSFCIDPRRRLIPIHRTVRAKGRGRGWAICTRCIASDEKGNRHREWNRQYVADNEAVRMLHAGRTRKTREAVKGLLKFAGNVPQATAAAILTKQAAELRELREVIRGLRPAEVARLLEIARQFDHKGPGRRKKLAAEETRAFEIGQMVQKFIPRATEALKAVAELPPSERRDLQALKRILLPLEFTLPQIKQIPFSKSIAVTLARHWAAESEHMDYASVARAHQRYLSRAA